MYICVCNGVTDKQIRDEVLDGADSFKAIKSCLGVGGNCGKCVKPANNLIQQTKKEILEFQTITIQGLKSA